jgi:hypothetical protein
VQGVPPPGLHVHELLPFPHSMVMAGELSERDS